MASNSSNQIIDMVEDFFKKLPPLPKAWTDVIVKIVPWIALIFGLLGVLASLAAIGVSTVVSPIIAMGGGVGAAANGMIGAVLALVSSGLLLASFPGTRKMKMSGWTLLFYSEVVSLVSSVVFLTVGGVIWTLVGLYIIFQIKKHYN